MAAKPCVFCEIVLGRVPGDVVAEGPDTVAFLDTRPLFRGHVLLVPRAHHETLGALPAELVAPLFTEARRLARGVERAFNSEGTFVAMNNRVSQSVPHLHVHVVPRTKGDGLKGFFWPRQSYASDEERAEFAARLRAALE